LQLGVLSVTSSPKTPPAQHHTAKETQTLETITSTITINRPVKDIFNWLIDFANHVQWQPNLIEAVVTSSGPVGLGSTYRYVTEVLGNKFPLTGEVTAYELNRIWGQKSHGGSAPVETVYQFESEGNNTQITVTMSAAIGSLPSAGGFVKQQLKRSLDEQNARLKQILEG